LDALPVALLADRCVRVFAGFNSANSKHPPGAERVAPA
jgi:hypothetical protein